MVSDAFLGGSCSSPGQVWAVGLYLLGAVLVRDCSTHHCASGRRDQTRSRKMSSVPELHGNWEGRR